VRGLSTAGRDARRHATRDEREGVMPDERAA
jgi:hypothetical protein